MNETTFNPWTIRHTIDNLKEELEAYPDNAPMLAELGRTLTKFGDHRLAISYFTDAIKLNPYNASFRSGRGIAHAIAGHDGLAIDDFTQALLIEPENVAVLSARGFAHLACDDFTMAIDDFTMAIDLGVNDPEVFYARGKAYWASATRGDQVQECVKKALGDISEAIARDPVGPERYFTRGLIYSLDTDELDLAIEDLSVAIDLNLKTDAKSNLVSMYHWRNMVYRIQSQFDLAAEDATDMIRLLPNEPSPVRCRANTYLEWGKPEDAIKDLNKAMRLDP